MTKKYLIGTDEAGVGPVFGPLVVCGVIVDLKNIDKLEKCGVKDSKLFGSDGQARKKRKNVWEKASIFLEDFQYKIISAEDLDKKNMYELEIEAIAEILIKLDWEKTEIIYIAQLGQTSFKKFLQRLEKKEKSFSQDEFAQKVIYEKDADSLYIPVSLASIIAKVKRDEEVEKLCQRIGESYISGYPNKKTEIFLRKYFKKHNALPPGTRKKRQWEPLKELIEKERNNSSLKIPYKRMSREAESLISFFDKSSG